MLYYLTILLYSHTWSCELFPQPTRLNVFKNDQETWDYTNPNLGGPGKTLMETFISLNLPLVFCQCHACFSTS